MFRWFIKGSLIAIVVGIAVIVWAHIFTQHGGQAGRLLVVKYDQTAVCTAAEDSKTMGPGFHWLADDSWTCNVTAREQ